MPPLRAPDPARLRALVRRPSATTLMLIGILAVGAYLRLADIDLGWFMLDQARDVRTARGIVEGCRVDEAPLPAGTTSRVYTPVAITSETVFDLSNLREGRHTISCLIWGQGTAFDLDVYEVRRGTAAVDPIGG